MLLIGFMGEAGSGKDLCSSYLVRQKELISVSFADVLKRFLKLTFGFSDQHLWGESKYRHVPIAPHLDSRIGWDIALERLTLNVRQWVNSLSLLDTAKDAFVKEVGRFFDNIREKTNSGKISARLALQMLGTEYGRKFQPSIWVDYLHEKVIPRIENGHAYGSRGGIGIHCGRVRRANKEMPNRGVIITDHRYINELEATQKNGGFVIKLNRLAKQETGVEEAGLKGHSSEAEQKELPNSAFDYILSLPEGKSLVYHCLDEMYERKAWLS